MHNRPTQITLLAILIIIFSACSGNFKIDKVKFNRDSKEVINELKNIDNFENVNVKWSINNHNNNVTHLLYINLINGNESSKDDSARKEIGKEAMSILLKSIDNDSSFDKFVVNFVFQKSTGIVTQKRKFRYMYNLNDFR
jgi:hypothetical protein